MTSDPQPISFTATGKSGAAGSLLRRYFYSGWAFLVPYLFCYLLYYLLKWPPNPGSGRAVPSLLHVYWALHLIHAMLGLLTVRAWWLDFAFSTFNAQSPTFRRPTPGLWPLASGLLPWFLLSLLFFIPGAYLEFPADPWEHFRRINAWSDFINSSLYLYKGSDYFFAYSFLRLQPGNPQSFWLDFYYTGICLLLCWQYFRLARAAGLQGRPALLFVLLQAVLLGNSAFSFYRYYGLASTMFAQLGAVALIRLGLEVATPRAQAAGVLPAPLGPQRLISPPCAVVSALGLALLIALNHIQGLGIALLGLTAVAVWRLLQWKRSTFWLLAAAAVILSFAAFTGWPHHRSLDRIYRLQGWLTPWDGFNIWSPRSPAGDRALQILGFFGVINLAAGLLLTFRNRVVGWLTIMPALALSLPFVAIPFAGVLAKNDGAEGIIVFHRMLFAIPAGLAIICVGWELAFRQTEQPSGSYSVAPAMRRGFFGAIILALLAFTTIPANGPFYNRTWNALAQIPSDLAMQSATADFKKYTLSSGHRDNAVIFATSGLSFVLRAAIPDRVAYVVADHHLYLNEGRSPAMDFDLIQSEIPHNAKSQMTIVIPQPTLAYTPYSFAALCSRHWLPQEAALAFAGASELRALGSRLGMHAAKPDDHYSYYEIEGRQ